MKPLIAILGLIALTQVVFGFYASYGKDVQHLRTTAIEKAIDRSVNGK